MLKVLWAKLFSNDNQCSWSMEQLEYVQARFFTLCILLTTFATYLLWELLFKWPFTLLGGKLFFFLSLKDCKSAVCVMALPFPVCWVVRQVSIWSSYWHNSNPQGSNSLYNTSLSQINMSRWQFLPLWRKPITINYHEKNCDSRVFGRLGPYSAVNVHFILLSFHWEAVSFIF